MERNGGLGRCNLKYDVNVAVGKKNTDTRSVINNKARTGKDKFGTANAANDNHEPMSKNMPPTGITNHENGLWATNRSSALNTAGDKNGTTKNETA